MNPDRTAPALRPATPADVAVALAWTPQADALRRWAGPNTRCPATPETLWADITSADATTFAYASATDGLVGLGQVRLRDAAFGHLARIIVSPAHRGRGHGRALCRALMTEARRLHPAIRGFTLYVFTDNAAAIALYRSMGYVDRGKHPQFDCLLMEAPLPA